MVQPVAIKSREQILGEFLRRIANKTDTTDFNVGAQVVTLLEALAKQAFQAELGALKVAEGVDVQNLTEQKLDARAESLGLTNGSGGKGRRPASRATGFATVSSGFTKLASNASPAFPAPFAGQSVLYVRSASGWPLSGNLYIGRNTVSSFEGPIPYTALVDNGSYWTVTLGGALTKDHAYTDQVVVAQGGDRVVSAGTPCQVPAASGLPPIRYTTETELLLPDGEDSGSVRVTAAEFGAASNADALAIKEFVAEPFTGARISNPLPIQNGQDTESDPQLRQRIQDYFESLSRGTIGAIRSGVVGLQDPASGQSISSFNYVQPPAAGAPTKIYVNDGVILEPTLVGQPYELILARASGREQQFRTAQSPVTPALLVSTEDGPFALADGMTITFEVDGVSETLVVDGANYRDPTSASATEVVRDLNGRSNLVEMRTIDGGKRLVVFDKTGGEVLRIRSGDAQAALALPLTDSRPIYVYVDSVLKSFRGRTATITSKPFSTWSLAVNYSAPGSSTAEVDGVSVSFNITAADFVAVGTTQAASVIEDWAEILNKKIPGVTFTVSANVLVATSNKGAKAGSSLKFSGLWVSGTDRLFAADSSLVTYASDTGFPKDYDLNRFTGEFRFVEKLDANSVVEIAAVRTRAYVPSIFATTGVFDLTTDPKWSAPRMVVAFDAVTATRSIVPTVTSTVTIDATTSNADFVRLTGDAAPLLSDVEVGDWLWINRDASASPAFSAGVEGLYRVKRRGTDWVEFQVQGPNSPGTELAQWVALDGVSVQVTEDSIQAFSSDAIPQVVELTASSTTTADSLVSQITSQVVGGAGDKISPQLVSVRSSRYTDGAAAVLGTLGGAKEIFVRGSAESIQFHVGHAESGFTDAVAPKVVGVSSPDSSFHARTFLQVRRNYTDVTGTTVNPAVTASDAALVPAYPVGFQEAWLTGKLYGLTGRVFNNVGAFPYDGFLRSELVVKNAGRFRTRVDFRSNISLRLVDLSITQYDRLVVQMDDDAAGKTVAVQMAKSAVVETIVPIAGSGRGEVVTLTLADPDDVTLGYPRPFFNLASPYRLAALEDFNVLARSVCLFRTELSGPYGSSGLIVRSAEFGGVNRVRFQVLYPTEPAQSAVAVAHQNQLRADVVETVISATLASGARVAGSLVNSGAYSYTVAAPVNNLCDVTISTASVQVQATATYKTFQFRARAPAYAGSLGNGIVVRIRDTLGYAVTPGTPPGTMTFTENVGLKILDIDLRNNVPSAAALTTLLSTSVLVDLVTGSGTIYVDSADATWVQTGVNPTPPPTVLAGYNQSVAVGGVDASNGAIGTGSSFPAGNLVRVRGDSSLVPAGAFLVTASGAGFVTFTVPNFNGLASQSSVDGSSFPFECYTVNSSPITALNTSVQAYLTAHPVAESTVVGGATNLVTRATYLSHTRVSSLPADVRSLFDAYLFHSVAGTASGRASVNLYDATLGEVRLTVQSVDPLFPVGADSSALGYTPVDERLYVVPSNSRTLETYLSLAAVSSMPTLARVERVEQGQAVQISTKLQGAAGSVEVRQTASNSAQIPLTAGSSDVGPSSATKTLLSSIRQVAPDSLVRVVNDLAAPILRPYRRAGSTVTAANVAAVDPWLRGTTELRYRQISSNVGRLIFSRLSQFSGTAPLAVGAQVTTTNLGSGLVRFAKTSGTGSLSARVGDMMHVSALSAFPASARCQSMTNINQASPGGFVGYRRADTPRADVFPGYPVVQVESANSVVVIAPNITSFGVTTIASATDLTFQVAVGNEKNIRTNRLEGAAYETATGSDLYMIVNKIGDFLSVIVSNSTDDTTDTAALATMSVSTDDWAVLDSSFDAANQGRFRVVAHDGRNHLVLYAPGAGKDQVIELTTDTPRWGVGPFTSARPVRVWDAETVEIGDKLRISAPVDATGGWFASGLVGLHTITDLGFFRATGAAADDFCAYVDFFVATGAPSAPQDVVVGAANVDSVGFVEGQPFTGMRLVRGYAEEVSDKSIADLYLAPARSVFKQNPSYGTSLYPVGKLGYPETPRVGVDGYRVWGGVVGEANRVVYGDPNNSIVYPGIQATGTRQEIQTAIARSCSFSLTILPHDGVTLDNISDVVRSAVAGYVNSLGVGRSAVISELVAAVQAVPGVMSVTVTSSFPEPQDGVIPVAENEVARILDVFKGVEVS